MRYKLSSASWNWHLLKHVWGTLPQHVNEPDSVGTDPIADLAIHNKRALQPPTVDKVDSTLFGQEHHLLLLVEYLMYCKGGN